MDEQEGFERYSEEQLRAAIYLSAQEDPIAEVDGGGGIGIRRITVEPGETLSIIRHNANLLIANCLFGDYEYYHGDLDILGVEERIQMHALENANREMREVLWPLLFVVLPLAIAVIGLIFGREILWDKVEGVFWAIAVLGSMILPFLLIMWLGARKKSRNPSRKLPQINETFKIIYDKRPPMGL